MEELSTFWLPHLVLMKSLMFYSVVVAERGRDHVFDGFCFTESHCDPQQPFETSTTTRYSKPLLQINMGVERALQNATILDMGPSMSSHVHFFARGKTGQDPFADSDGETPGGVVARTCDLVEKLLYGTVSIKDGRAK